MPNGDETGSFPGRSSAAGRKHRDEKEGKSVAGHRAGHAVFKPGGGYQHGCRHIYNAVGMPGCELCGLPPVKPEAEALRAQARFLEDHLKAIYKRIRELEKLESENQNKE